MNELGKALLILARNAIAGHFGLPVTALATDLPALHEAGATFVTLTQRDNLRGCIGSLEAWRPLLVDVRENALAAALRDPRFVPLSGDELAITRIEVSLLTPPAAIAFGSQAEALASLRPHIDGVIFSAGPRRSTFLPQVWEQLPQPVDFMAHLKQKAGLPANYWGDDVRLERYTVEKWQEAAR